MSVGGVSNNDPMNGFNSINGGANGSINSSSQPNQGIQTIQQQKRKISLVGRGGQLIQGNVQHPQQ